MPRSSAQKKVVSLELEAPSEVRTGQAQERIAELAYLKAEARGFSPGHELEDWLAAEAEINHSASADSRV